MGQFTGVSLKLLPPNKIIFNDIDDSDWPNLLTFRGVIMRVRHRLSRTKWLPVLFVTLKLLQVNATIVTCELREKKQLPTTMLQSSRKMRVMTSRVSYKDI